MRRAFRPTCARRVRRCTAPAVIAAMALAAAAAAGAHDGPAVRSDADVVRPGHRNVLRGESWFVGPRCAERVSISQREAHGFRLGTARIRDNGTFRFTHRVPRDASRGTRIVLDVTQLCDGVGTSRTVRIRIGRDHHGCGTPLSVDGIAYDVEVIGGLRCRPGKAAVGDFIDLGIEPDGWACARVDRGIAGHDVACTDIARPGRRVEARRVREV